MKQKVQWQEKTGSQAEKNPSFKDCGQPEHFVGPCGSKPVVIGSGPEL